MAKRSRPATDFDSPWKEALEHFLPQFLEFFYRHIHRDIDWSKGYESLDKELHQLVRDAKVPKGLADKLFQVWLKDGRESWLLIHIEVQGQPEEGFPRRVFVYNFRSFERYNRAVVSLVLLTDEQAGWRPDHFEYGQWVGRMRLDFLPVKLLEFAGREVELERDANPFAQVALAHLEALATRQDASARRKYKVQLIKGLYDRGWTPEDVRQLFRIIDWMMDLPDDLQQGFRSEIAEWEEDQRMPYVTSIERLAKAEGKAEGKAETSQEDIAALLESKFGAAGKRLSGKVRKITDLQQLRSLFHAALKAESLAEVRSLIQ